MLNYKMLNLLVSAVIYIKYFFFILKMAYPIQFIILYKIRHFVIRPILIYLQIVKNAEFASVGDKFGVGKSRVGQF